MNNMFGQNGQMPNMGDMMNNPMVQQMMNNPDMMKMAQQMMGGGGGAMPDMANAAQMQE